jgi:hypothetical protein
MPRVLLPVLYAAALAAPLSGQTQSVAVFMDFDSQPAAVPLAVMEKEAGDLMKSAGISLDWRLVRQNHGAEAFAGLVVLKFKGQCRVDTRSKAVSDFGSIGQVETLGITRVDRGHVLPYTEVQCDQVRKALAYLKPGAGSKERQNALGLALGRVVAHELYHVLARTTAHAKEGLAKASQSLRDLVSTGYMGFGEDVSERIRVAVR